MSTHDKRRNALRMHPSEAEQFENHADDRNPSGGVDRRQFLHLLGATGCAWHAPALLKAIQSAATRPGAYAPGRIENEYALFLPGEQGALTHAPQVRLHGPQGGEARLAGSWQKLAVGESLGGWKLVLISEMNGVATAVFEKTVTHRGAIAYVTELGGTIACVPKGVGDLAQVRPRPVNTTDGVKLKRSQAPGPDVAGDYILHSNEDPCYENVAALGPEYIGWSLVANEHAGPEGSVYLEADGRSRQPRVDGQQNWAPDLEGPLFDPVDYFPFDHPEYFAYKPGWSKRTLLGGYLPAACTAVWNADYRAGYELTMLLPPGADARAMARIRLQNPDGTEREHFWNCGAGSFYENVLGLWNHWSNFFENTMPVEVPDPWLLDAARAGITLSRCSYTGLEPTYEVGEGGYTKIPERSHALFPVAHYEFIWAHQIWNLTSDSDEYFQFYLDRYILPDGNFLYNTQDQVEGPMNTGYVLWNSARSYNYTGDTATFTARLPVLERMLGYVLGRYTFSKEHYPRPDRRYGLIWGSPEADLGDPNNDTPNAHPFYYQNAAAVWRGLHEHARALKKLGTQTGDQAIAARSEHYTVLAAEMRENIRVSLEATIAAGDPAMRAAAVTPFETNDTKRQPTELSSYENHRFMMDWFLSDWGDPALDVGHLKHRHLAGEQICGLNTDGDVARSSNFMSHGTLAVGIRQDDYRPFLLTLYALVCYAADSGNRYAPEDAYIPGSYPGEGGRYGWSAVINSTLQPTLGLRWLLCYEESDADVCHLQKAAPKHWFAAGQKIRVGNCPTRWGQISWSTEAVSSRAWTITIEVPAGFAAAVAVHIHPADGAPLRSASSGTLMPDRVVLPAETFATKASLIINVT